MAGAEYITQMRIFLSAGEPSGDLHASNLARALRARLPHAELVGYGGDRMAAAGVNILYPLTDLAVMGFVRVLPMLPKFLHVAAKAESYFRTHRPAALVLVDFPGFHWHLALRAHRYKVPVYYFVPPQLWAWASYRASWARHLCKAVLTALPFEEPWYASRGVRTHYVGHPYFDEIAAQQPSADFLAEQRAKGGEVVGILPGSRTHEVTSNLPMMLDAADRIAAARPGVRFLIASFKPKQAALAAGMLAGRKLNAEIHTGCTPEIIEQSKACLAVSGSVGLELLVRTTPAVVVYKVGRVMHAVGKRVVRAKFISLVNLLADEELLPEYPVAWDVSAELAARVLRWLNDPAEHAAMVAKMEALKAKVAAPGAVERAAEFLVGELHGGTGERGA